MRQMMSQIPDENDPNFGGVDTPSSYAGVPSSQSTVAGRQKSVEVRAVMDAEMAAQSALGHLGALPADDAYVAAAADHLRQALTLIQQKSAELQS